MSKNILLVTASEGKNLELARHFQAQLEALGARVTIVNVIDLELPLYTSRSEQTFSASDLLKKITPLISQAQAFVFLAPEYNGGPPPAFSNFLAWLSRSAKNWREPLNGKPAAIASHSGGGGHHLLTMLRLQLAFVGMNVVGRQLLISPQKNLDEGSLKNVVTELLKLAG